MRRLARLREQVNAAWKCLEADQTNDAVQSVYNKHVAAYNAALDVFPAISDRAAGRLEAGEALLNAN